MMSAKYFYDIEEGLCIKSLYKIIKIYVYIPLWNLLLLKCNRTLLFF